MQTEATPPDPYATGSAVVEAQIELDAGAGLDSGPRVRIRLSTALLLCDGRWRGVSLRTTAGEGRHLVASRDLAAGTVVCTSPAYALSTFEEYKKRVCACCFTVAAGRLEHRCAACDQVYYCNASCRAAHAAHGAAGSLPHALTCPVLAALGPVRKCGGKSLQAVLRLVIEAIARRELEPGAAAGFFAALESHPPRRTPKEASEWSRATEHFRRALAASTSAPLAAAAATIDERELHELVSKVDSNCFGCFVPSDGGDRDVGFGHGVYLAASMFNHSCAPNCAATTGIDKMEIRTAAAVAAGTELSINYCDTNRPVDARRAYLRSCYGFECGCTRCAAESTPGRAGARLSYDSRVAPQQRTSREKRERREQRAARKAGTVATTPATADVVD